MSEWGPHVRRRLRKNGTYRYYQQFYPRLRPPNWPKTVDLYAQPHSGEPSDQDRAEILRLSLEVYDALLAARAAAGSRGVLRGPRPDNAWTRLGDRLMRDSIWADNLSEASIYDMQCKITVIGRHLDGKPEMAPECVTNWDLEQYVRQRQISVSSQNDYQKIFNRLLEHAVASGIRPQHVPIRFGLKRGWRKARKRVRLWEASDVAALSELAAAEDEPGLADLMCVGYETGARLGDLRQMRFGFDYNGGEIYFLTNKTDAPILLPLSDDTRARLDKRFKPGALLFPRQNGKVFSTHALSRRFRILADSVPEYRSSGLGRSDPDLIALRHLRHSAVVAFALEDVPIPHIASVTGHAIETVYQIIEFYLPRHPGLARRAMEKRFGVSRFNPNPRPVVGWDDRTRVGALPRPAKPKAA